jgi:hypothetical protein
VDVEGVQPTVPSKVRNQAFSNLRRCKMRATET